MNARTARQWMVTHEWMIKPMAQAEWIEGKGLLVWLAEVFSALGTGLYLVSLFFSQADSEVTAFWGGMLGWICIAIFKLPLHLPTSGSPGASGGASRRSATRGRPPGSPGASSSP